MNRDRFVLSNGHACALQYSMLHLTGYDLALSDLEAFRKLNSKTPGHPENFCTPGVEVCTGPLGQGLCNAVGLALARTHLAARFNRPRFPLFDHAVFAICGDGCLMEGLTGEASAIAGELAPPGLVLAYDDNEITIDGSTDLAFTENVSKRYQAYGWNVSTVADGNSDFSSLLQAVQAAKASASPTIIKVKTTIGFGSQKQGTPGVHGAPLSMDDLSQMRKTWGFPEDKPFWVPKKVEHFYRQRGEEGDRAESAWQELLGKYSAKHPSEHAELTRRIGGTLPNDIEQKMTRLLHNSSVVEAGDPILCTLLASCPECFGGSMAGCPVLGTADVPSPSRFTFDDRKGRMIDFGANREHAAAAVVNGFAAYGGILPFWRCPMSDIANAWGAIRLSALASFQVLHIATWDGCELAATEVFALVRATPNISLCCPADDVEVAGAYLAALRSRSTPTMVVLPAPQSARVPGTCMTGAARGGYRIATGVEGGTPSAVLIASGSSALRSCLQAQHILESEGLCTRVVSLVSWELFQSQSSKYRDSVLPAGTPSLHVESGSGFGCEAFSRHHLDADQVTADSIADAARRAAQQ